MKLSMTFVPVRKIKPSASRWNFSEEAMEQAARLVAKVEGIINPLVLRRENTSESYEVLDGNFEYFVAVRASELEPRTCETIAAFIIEPEDEAVIREQIERFRHRPQLSETSSSHSSTDLETRLRQLEFRQAELESRQLTFEVQDIKPIKQQLQELETQPDRKMNLLAAFNEVDHSALLRCLRQAGLIGRNAEKIVEAIESERQHQKFRSLKEIVIRVKGLTYEKMLDLLEAL